MNHDCGKECAAAVREATAPLEELLRASTRENLNLKDRLAELTRCRTAADLQHARERQQRAMFTYQPTPGDVGWPTAPINRYQRTDEDGPMWRPEDVTT
jgi:hypothetical protein